MTNFFSQIIFKLLSVVFSVVFAFSGPIGGTTPEDVVHTPDDFTPVVRFVVCSDIHLDGDETQQAAIRFANLFTDMYEYAEGCDYKNLDAVLVAGDFTGGGAEKEYQIYNKIINENKKDETQILTVLGNHEFIDYRDVDASVGYDVYRKYVNEDVDTGNIKFFVHGLDYENQLAKFDAFGLVDSDVLLSISYAERPESKYRFFRAQGVLLDFDTKYIHGGGNTDAGSGCGKTIADFKKDYIFGGERETDRLYVSDLIKKATGMSDSEYIEFIKANEKKEKMRCYVTCRWTR